MVRERIDIKGKSGDAKTTATQLASEAVETAKIKNLAVTTGKLAADAVTGAKLADEAVDSEHFVDGSVDDVHLASSLVKEPGHIAGGRLDFAGVASGGVTVTIGAVVYREEDAEDFPNGEWTNGGSGNDSAVSLAAAINGDTRNGGGPSYAAVVLTDTVFVFALAVGTAGNVSASVSAGEPATIENLVGGTEAVVKQTAVIMHTVTALEVAVASNAPEVLIPIPFDAAFFSWQVYDSSGGIYATEITARGTVTTASGDVPAFFHLANNGAVDVQSGDIIRLVVQE